MLRCSDDTGRAKFRNPPRRGRATPSDALPHSGDCVKRQQAEAAAPFPTRSRREDLMADNHDSAMDYAEHDRTYALFIAMTKWGSVSIVVLLILMALFLL
jgi:hypothetical protein